MTASHRKSRQSNAAMSDTYKLCLFVCITIAFADFRYCFGVVLLKEKK